MSRRVPLNVRFRPQPVATDEIDRSARTAEQLLDGSADWLRRLHCARVDVELEEPAGRAQPALALAGFRALCTATVRHPGPLGRLERRVHVWIDATATIRAEVIGARVYFSTLFDDGTSLALIPDPTVAEWVRSPACEVVCGRGVVHADLESFLGHHQRSARQGREPLLCADGDAYRRHLRLAFLRHSKRAPIAVTRTDGQLTYPMTWLLAAEMLTCRDDFADARGLSLDGRSSE